MYPCMGSTGSIEQSARFVSKNWMAFVLVANVVLCLFPLVSAKAGDMEKGFLFVYPEPADASVEVADIEEEYFPGIALEPGAYRVKVEKDGYVACEQTIQIEPKRSFDFFAELKKAARFIDRETGMEFVRIPGGCFDMGCGKGARDCQSDEVPTRKVCVKEFWMGKYEVTQGVWEKIMEKNPSKFKKGPNYPVEQVSWSQAVEFVSKLKIAGGFKARLPSEAEWEYAARDGGRGHEFAGGGDVSLVGWYQGNSEESTHPAGLKKANGFGLHDMSGNVWEWCQDAYHNDAYQKDPKAGPAEDAGPVLFRVRRGGSWICEKPKLRCLFRGRYPPEMTFESNGLRVVLEAE